MTTVVDASVVVAALTDSSGPGQWSRDVLRSDRLASPAIMPVEVANVLRRAQMAGQLSDDIASLSHRDLLDLDIELFAYAPLGPRVWELRHNITSYDGCYVALGEALDAPVATLDDRLRGAPGATCRFLGPATD